MLTVSRPARLLSFRSKRGCHETYSIQSIQSIFPCIFQFPSGCGGKTHGMEAVLNSTDVQAGVMHFNGRAPCADSLFKERSGCVATPGGTLGQYPLQIQRVSQPGIAHFHSL